MLRKMSEWRQKGRNKSTSLAGVVRAFRSYSLSPPNRGRVELVLHIKLLRDSTPRHLGTRED